VPIVVGGLGQPEDGNLVAQGMGHAGAAAPGEMAAVITANATVTAAATTTARDAVQTMASRSSRIVPYPALLLEAELDRLRKEEEDLLLLLT
jgi:hypothetical protein